MQIPRARSQWRMNGGKFITDQKALDAAGAELENLLENVMLLNGATYTRMAVPGTASIRLILHAGYQASCKGCGTSKFSAKAKPITNMSFFLPPRSKDRT